MGRPILLLFSLLGTGMASVQMDVRCYCNLPACIATGHMCRSSARMCLSEKVGGDEGRTSLRHACFELVSRRASPSEFCAENNTTRHCCADDMCNYPKRGAPPSVPLNHSHVTGYLSNRDTSLLRGTNPSSSSSWFRFAVAAVPVVGGAVLLVLVVVATRMLRAGEYSRPETFRKPSLQTHSQREREQRPLAKSLSCVVLDRCHAGRPVVRSCTSMVSLGHTTVGLDHSISEAFSTETGRSDSSRDKYFVFDL